MRRRRLQPPDLTSLFDVLFIVVFAALIRASAAQNAAATPAPAPAPAPAPPSPSVTQLHDRALADLAARKPLAIRMTHAGVLDQIEADGNVIAVGTPVLAQGATPDDLTYAGDLCALAAKRLGAADLRAYLVIIATDAALEDLPHALYEGLRGDVDRCPTIAGASAVLVGVTP